MRVRRQFNQYEIDAEIGQGGMSRVFRATDPALNRHVALKILLGKFSADDERVAAFEKEARVMASLTHPHVVKLFSVGRDQGYFYLVMELVEQGSLDELLMRQGKASEKQALLWTLETAHGLQAAYASGLLHRDVKPGNILLSKDRSAKLVDFGLALMIDRDKKEEGEIWATPYYVPPEKLERWQEDHRSDIYSLGATLYHLLVGKPSFEVRTGSFDELRKAKAKSVHVRQAAPQISAPAATLVERMMAPDPARRPGSYEEVIETLGALLGEGASVSNVSLGAAESFLRKQRQEKHARRRRLRIGLAAVAGLGLAALVGGLLFNSPEPSPPASTQLLPTENSESEDSVSATLSQRYLEGRSALLDGRYVEAADHFREVAAADEVPQTTKNWSLYNGGIALLLDGKERAARRVFDRLGKQDMAEESENGRALKEFFDDVSEWMASDEVIPGNISTLIEPGFCRPAALLAYGLKNWNLKAYEDAGAHFERLSEMAPGKGYEWINTYRDHVAGLVHDVNILAQLPGPAGQNPKVIERRLGKARDLLGELQSPQGIALTKRRIQVLSQRLDSLTEKEEAAAAVEARREVARAFEKLHELDVKLKPLGKSLQFQEADGMLGSFVESATSPKIAQAVADRRHFWQQALGGLRTATSRGDRPNPDPAGIAAQLETLIAEIRDANQYYERWEQLVAFAYCTGLDELCRKQAENLRLENRPFRERWDRLQSSSDQPNASSS